VEVDHAAVAHARDANIARDIAGLALGGVAGAHVDAAGPAPAVCGEGRFLRPASGDVKVAGHAFGGVARALGDIARVADHAAVRRAHVDVTGVSLPRLGDAAAPGFYQHGAALAGAAAEAAGEGEIPTLHARVDVKSLVAADRVGLVALERIEDAGVVIRLGEGIVGVQLLRAEPIEEHATDLEPRAAVDIDVVGGGDVELLVLLLVLPIVEILAKG